MQLLADMVVGGAGEEINPFSPARSSVTCQRQEKPDQVELKEGLK